MMLHCVCEKCGHKEIKAIEDETLFTDFFVCQNCGEDEQIGTTEDGEIAEILAGRANTFISHIVEDLGKNWDVAVLIKRRENKEFVGVGSIRFEKIVTKE